MAELEELGVKAILKGFGDNEGLFKNVYSNNPNLAEKRYMAHLFCLRETYSPRVTEDTPHRYLWMPGTENYADPMTKWDPKTLEVVIQWYRTGCLDLSGAILPDLFDKAFCVCTWWQGVRR